MIITKTPFRISFFGGGTDMEEYFKDNKGAVLSTTFDKYNYVIVNDKVEDSVKRMSSIIDAEKSRVDRIEEIYLGNEEELIHEILMDM